ncbi:hypothetical protein Tco_1364668 [Tanacetum coccineum]
MDYHLARDREQHLSCELFGYREDSNEVISEWKAGLKDDMDARSDVYVISNDDMVFSCGCKAEIWVTKGLLDKEKENILGMEIVRDQSGDTLRVSQSRFYNGKLVQILLEGHSILSLKGSISGDCDGEKNGKWSCIYAVGSQEYQVVYTILDIASADVGMLDKLDRGLQTDVQVFMDFYYAMERSINVMGRSITRYGLMIQGCAGSLKANLQHMEALSTTEAVEIWATKGLLDKAKGNVLGMEIIRDQSGDCDVEKNGKWSCIYAVGSQEYQVVYTILDIASADVGMLDKLDRGLQTDVQVFVDFDYAMERSIIVMGRSITRCGLMIQGCAGSREAMMLHMMALSPTEAGYMTLTKAAKEAIGLKGLAIKSGFELKIVAGIATGFLSKAIPGLTSIC